MARKTKYEGETLEVGERVRHRGYDIVRECEKDFIVNIAHDTLADAKAWIDGLIATDDLEGETPGKPTKKKSSLP